MKQALWCASAVMLLVGCSGPLFCSEDKDCLGGGVCDPDFKICVQPDGGAGGGAGGGTGGGGGGPALSCAGVSCSAWQTCQPTADGGVCRDVVLTVLTPGATVGVGPFQLSGTVVQWDGGGFVGSVPVAMDGGVSGAASLPVNRTFSGTYSVPVSGRYVLWVGWDGGVQRTVAVSALGCESASPQCKQWQTCEPTLDGGACRDVTLAIQSPAALAEYPAGSIVTLQATVTQWDGGSYPGNLPVTSTGFVSGNAGLSPSVSGTYSGPYGLPASSGLYTLTIGWQALGGPTVSRSVYSVACEVARCAEWQECVPSRTGGACQSLLLNLVVAPVAPAVVGPNTLVQLSATLTRPDAGTVPSSIPWTRPAPVAASGRLLATGYLANIDGGAPTGTYAFTVGWQDGGPVQSASYTVDATPPAFTVFVPAPPIYAGDSGTFWPNDSTGPAYRRDETLDVEVYSTATDVNSASVALTAQFASDGVYPVPAAVKTSCLVNAGAGFCTRFPVDISLVPMQRFSGTVTFTATGTDGFGNAATPATGTARVTRWQWARQVDPAAGSLKGSPAVDKAGTFWLTLNTTGGGLISVSPTGGLGASTADGLSDISPAIARNASGTEFVFYETAAGGGTLRMAGGSQPCGSAGATTPHGSLAILSDTTAGFMGVGLQGSTAGSRIVGLEGGATCRFSADGLQTVAFSGNLATSGTSVFWGDVNGLIQGATFGGVAFNLTSSQSHGGGTNNGILLFDGGVGLEIAGGGNNLGAGRLYAFASPLTTPSVWSGSTGYSSNPLSGPIATTSGVVAALRSAATTLELLRVDYAGGNKQALASTGLAFTGAQVPTPVAGRGGLLYVIDEVGNMAVASQSFVDGVSATRWSVGLPAAIVGATSASPTLVCNTRKPTATTGVLAFATETGWLVTYLVDSKGLDTSAPWPKYGHDIRNTNNPATTVETCP